MSGAVEVTIDTIDPVILDGMWAAGANGVFEREHDSVVGFDEEAIAQAAITTLPADVEWSMAPSPPLNTWDSYAGVVTDDPFLIRPPWLEAGEPRAGLTELVIDPGTSFGHGGHPTTLLGLRALAREIRPEDSVLDVGSGSGVLAIAAATLGAASVTATDIDPAAVETTEANAQANDVAIVACSTRVHDLTGPFDVVIANMERPTLAVHLDELWQLTARVLILSGVLAADPLDLAGLDAARVSVEQLDDWAATSLHRHHHPQVRAGTQ